MFLELFDGDFPGPYSRETCILGVLTWSEDGYGCNSTGVHVIESLFIAEADLCLPMTVVGKRNLPLHLYHTLVSGQLELIC